jgi:hypothetical protein
MGGEHLEGTPVDEFGHYLQWAWTLCARIGSGLIWLNEGFIGVSNAIGLYFSKRHDRHVAARVSA